MRGALVRLSAMCIESGAATSDCPLLDALEANEDGHAAS
jgi:hypothetical protein